MDEHANRLRATITELERELHSVDKVDPQTREMLLEAVEEIQTALQARTAPDAEPITTESPTLGDQLNRAAVDFDTSHPALAGLLRRVVDALAQIGI